MATASHGELTRLPSRDGIKQQKAEGKGKGKVEGSKDPWVPRDWDTRTHLKKLSPDLNPEWEQRGKKAMGRALRRKHLSRERTYHLLC
ncbi:hypothetical protein AVEN_114268-1 [Araneus ventricosus]|uniref:Uncharacterized protein n=1 Tax=Araneus ventricosus TaxID=182803 RepID=A0A4Y2MHW7_ARAVE|nr:hypothetical protein AVEN_114268-1 [Araneus ventricosus]